MNDYVIAVCWTASGNWTLLNIHGRVFSPVFSVRAANKWSREDFDRWSKSSDGLSLLQSRFSGWKLLTIASADAWTGNGIPRNLKIEPQEGIDHRGE